MDLKTAQNLRELTAKFVVHCLNQIELITQDAEELLRVEHPGKRISVNVRLDMYSDLAFQNTADSWPPDDFARVAHDRVTLERRVRSAIRRTYFSNAY